MLDNNNFRLGVRQFMTETEARRGGVQPAAVRRFRVDGYLVVRGLVSEPERVAIAGPYERLAEQHALNQAQAGCGLIYIDNPTARHPEWRCLPFYGKARRMARQLIGDDLIHREDQVIIKLPGYPGETPWHQDAGYWHRLGSPLVEGVVCWIALSPSCADAGGLQFVPGAHRQGLRPHDDRRTSSDIPEALGMEVDATSAVAPELAPGDATFHHYLTPHFSAGNAPPWARAVLSFHFWRGGRAAPGQPGLDG